jgi:hypothetical protein
MGAFLLDFPAAFEMIDNNLLLEKPVMALHSLLYCGFRVTCLSEYRACSLMEASPT